MSDPAKSANEIEDVLASIRRLVSESHAAPARPSSIGPVGVPLRPRVDAPAPAATPRTGKLMLTPALRVTDPDDPWAPVPVKVEEGAAATAQPDESTAQDWDPDDRLSDWGEIEESAEESVADAIAEQDAAPFHPALREDGGAEPDAADLTDLATLDGVEAEGLADFEPETGDVNWPDTSAGSALRDLALARGQGAVTADAPISDADDEFEPAPVEAMSQEQDAPVALADESTEDEEPGTMILETPEDEDRAPEPPPVPVFSRRIDVKRPTAPPDAAKRPEATGFDAEDESDSDDDIEDMGEAPSPFTFPETEDGLLDEETLRDLIAEVVREELQGALGQRITRNVRKMVRREIRLALAAEDLE